MATSKERKNKLIAWADETIRNSRIYENGEIISESFNGQIAAFSVSVALSGLKPTMAVYYDQDSGSDVDKNMIVELLADLYNKDKQTCYKSKEFYDKIIGLEPQEEPNKRRDIIEYAIALKLAIRTFKFKKS